MRTTGFIIFTIACHWASAQTRQLTLEQAVKAAIENNQSIRASSLEVKSYEQLKKTGFDLPKTNVSLLYGQYNSYAKNDNNITITQSIPLIAFGSQASLNKALVASARLRKAVNENELTYQVKQVYLLLLYEKARRKLLQQQDSIFQGFAKAANLRYSTGETNLLEKITAETQLNEIVNQIIQNDGTVKILRSQLQTLLNASDLPDVASDALIEIPFEHGRSFAESNPSLAWMRQQVEVANSELKVERAKSGPDLLIGYFNQTLIDVPHPENGSLATASDRFSGIQVGISFPLWFIPHQGRVKAADYNRQATQSKFQNEIVRVNGLQQQAISEIEKANSSLSYYKQSALPNADIILRQVQTALRNGNIGYAEYLLGVRSATSIKESFLRTLNDYNQAVIYIEFLSGIN